MEAAERAERNWRGMVRVGHGLVFAWRRAVAARYGEQVAEELELRFWEEVGRDTASAHLASGLDPRDTGAMLRRLARSSEVMGEEVRVEQEGEEWRFVHDACPWPGAYRREGLATTCRPGCDRWLATTLQGIDPGLGVETLGTVPEGAAACVRRVWRR